VNDQMDPVKASAALAEDRKKQQFDLVMQYPDIAAKLCRPPLKLGDPRNWSGYIPGFCAPETVRGVIPVNDSPIRAQLIAILNEAAERSDLEARPAIANHDPEESQ